MVELGFASSGLIRGVSNLLTAFAVLGGSVGVGWPGVVALAHPFERLLERGHQVRDRSRLLLLVGDLDRAALALGVDHAPCSRSR